MGRPTDIINLTGNYEASLAQLAKKLGTEKVRRAVFRNMYGKHRRPRSTKQICDALGYPLEKKQQVQNALSYLEQHHFVEKVRNEGEVKDGSRSLYKKVDSLRGHVSQLEKLADDKQRRDALAASTRNQQPAVATPQRITRARLKKKKTLTVLFLSSNPIPDLNLRTDVEFAKVQDAIRQSRYRDNVRIEHRPAANVQTILNGLNDLRPDIIHFSGHGDQTGLYLDDQSVPEFAVPGQADDFSMHAEYALLAKALKATDFPPKLVVLNSCYSSESLKSIGGLVDATITMDLPVSDIAAAVFSPQLYSALASGQSLHAAFSQALIAVEIAVIDDVDIPQLHANDKGKSAIFV
ncbi:MAG: CHAT domain-containing protein [Erythrobacter sp.]|jgi:hypothetical protein|nr:CHAT domain-containing protein [Erythrobacter sp.]